MSIEKHKFYELLTSIENADDLQLNHIMAAVENRYRTTYPEWEVIYVAVQREPEKRRKDIDSIVERLYRI